MKSIIDYLEYSAEKYGDKIAIADSTKKYTYKQLRDLSLKLAQAIPSDLKKSAVCVFTDRDADVAVLFLSIVYSGNYYVPIDPEMPTTKKQAIIDDSGCMLILGSEEMRILLNDLVFTGRFMTIDDAVGFPRTLPEINKEDPLYMIYTSGSTGKPKGVLKSHRSMVDFIETYVNEFDFSHEEIIGNQTPFYFDASAKDFYLSLKLGATLEIIPTEIFAMPAELIDYMNKKHVSFISWVPTALTIISKLKMFSFVKPEYLKKCFFVGEVMPLKHLNYWRANLPDVQYVNLYGQSEIAGVSCYYEVKGNFSNDQVLPMGKPFDNCKVYLIDENGIISCPGKIGEIYIVSEALAMRYYNDEQKTKDCFLFKDFGNGPERCFKTSDLAEYDEEGNLLFASRSDFQIKHMGRRIELGEIEVMAGSIPEIQRCCALYDGEKGKIVLFVELNTDCSWLSGKDIRRILKGKLSSYMLPSKVQILEALPINANGKIDRQKLKESL